MKKIAKFLFGVKQELKKVRWPNKKEMIVYSTATVAFICIFCLFFAGIDLILAGIKVWVK